MRWLDGILTQEDTEELYKKDLHDPDNHDGAITHLEPGILECEVKWTLGSITMNKASGLLLALSELFFFPTNRPVGTNMDGGESN